MENAFDSSKKVTTYTDHRYSTWIQKGISGREHQLLGSLLDELGPVERILDMPVGYGRFSSMLLPRAENLISLDLSHYMLDQARDQMKSLKQEKAGAAHFVGACSTRLPLADKSVDLVVTIRLFHHLVNRDYRMSILKEMSRVTRKKVILTYYRSGTIHQLQRLVKNVRPKGKRLAFHSPEQFLRETGDAGLEVERLIKLKRAVHSQTFAVLRPR